MNEFELEALTGAKRVFDYTQFSHDNHVNVIPEESFHQLVKDTFDIIAQVLKKTYGPYGSTIMISDQNQTTSTKDGYNIYCAMGFNHHYKRMVYLAIKQIIERVNTNVGDGTTSCIMLASHIYCIMNTLMKSPENKRKIKSILDQIEAELQNVDTLTNDMETNKIVSLTESSLYNLLRMASNYDDELVDYLIDALNPECERIDDPSTKIVNMNNVIVDASETFESANTSYEVQHLPGKYRVRIDMDTDFALTFTQPTDVKVVLYDHTFGPSDWVNFMKNYDKETPTFVIAKSYSKSFLNNEYVRYLKERGLVKKPVKVFLCAIDGGYIQDELKDLAAVLHTTVHDVNNLLIDHTTLPTATIQVYNYNCLCFHDVESPTEYVDKLVIQLSQEKSYVKQTLLKDRIKALKMESKDTLIKVKAETSLELKMISDKIDDCLAIAKSAFNYGIIPNLLWYGYHRIQDMISQEHDTLKHCVLDAFTHAIIELATDIYQSKYNDLVENDDKLKEWGMTYSKYYKETNGEKSYDIIQEKFVDMTELPTSAQYDIEIIVAAISIVKYLLSSRALIFDAFLLQPQGDQGHFVREE